ncbi:hypothetical protein ACFL59_16120 [Planctomycetota bacterium]
MANTRLYAVDRSFEATPTGVVGELCIAGAGVARGYLGRPALTAERFVPDPFGPEPGARMYRSGDLARWLPSRALQLCGRTDHQVKVRGCRIELGEVEAMLSAHPRVRDACVKVWEPAAGGRRLAAYTTLSAPPSGGTCGCALPPRGTERRHLRRCTNCLTGADACCYSRLLSLDQEGPAFWRARGKHCFRMVGNRGRILLGGYRPARAGRAVSGSKEGRP